MEAKASLVGVAKDYKTDRLRLTFEVENDVSTDIEAISGKALRLKAVKWKEKRSLDANAYCWKLMGDIARALHSTADEIYELALRDLCIPDIIDGETVTVDIDSDIPLDRLPGHWKIIGTRINTVEGYRRNQLLKLKGSSEYNTAEMSSLIDLIVDQAKELGIETMTPDEVERMKCLWKAC